jgi:hypothetical protein
MREAGGLLADPEHSKGSALHPVPPNTPKEPDDSPKKANVTVGVTHAAIAKF